MQKNLLKTTWGPYFDIEEKNMQDPKTKITRTITTKIKKTTRL